MTRTRPLLAGLAALLALAALVAGIPWALWHYVGWPLPHAIPSWTQVKADLVSRGIPAAVLLKALAVVVWVAWGVLSASVLAEVVAAVGGRAGRPIPLAGPLQPLVCRLVAAVAIAVLASGLPRPPSTSPVSLAASLGASQPRAVVTALVARDPARAYPPTDAPAGASTPTTLGAGELRRYEVRRRDTLWGIAQAQLGDPTRWREIFTLNAGRPQPSGVALTDPNRIWPGWTLLLPPATPVPAGGAAPAGDPQPRVSPRPVAAPPPPPLPQPPAAPSERAAPSVTGRHARPTAPTRGDETRAASPAGWIELASGSRVGAGFAAGVLAALTAARLRRRRRYQPRPPAPGVFPSATPPPPPALRDLLAATRRHDPDEPGCGPERASPASTSQALPATAALAVPGVQPDLIEVGTRDGQVLQLALTGWGGLAVSGAGATGTVRAWLAALLTRAGPYGAELVATSELLDRLLPGAGQSPALRPVPDAAAVLGRLETELLARSRRLDDAEVSDAAAYRSTNPEDPFPAILAVLEALPPGLLGRWRAVLDAGHPLAMGALLITGEPALDARAAGARLVIDAQGWVRDAAPAELAMALAGARAFRLDAAEVADLLGPVSTEHAARAGQLGADGAEEPPVVLGGTLELATPICAGFAADDDSLARKPTDGARIGEPPHPERRGPAGIAEPSLAAAAPAPVMVALLGPYRIWAHGEEVATGLRSGARELLAWYLLRPEGGTAEAAIDAIWGELDLERGRQHFWNAQASLRARLRGSGDAPDADVLVKAGALYRPHPQLLDADVWRFHAALGDAARAGDAPSATAALERAVASFRGDLLVGTDYAWAEQAREDVHRRGLDAHLRLAELHDGAGRPEAALATLEHAIVIDPIGEEAYRRLLALQGRLGRIDAVQRTWRLLRRKLADLDLEPETATVALYRRVGEPVVRSPDMAGRADDGPPRWRSHSGSTTCPPAHSGPAQC
ncbi:MAG: BTAD domain-containing putative transcriptional regulator [Mycobacteriales bacterium]